MNNEMGPTVEIISTNNLSEEDLDKQGSRTQIHARATFEGKNGPPENKWHCGLQCTKEGSQGNISGQLKYYLYIKVA